MKYFDRNRPRRCFTKVTWKSFNNIMRLVITKYFRCSIKNFKPVSVGKKVHNTSVIHGCRQNGVRRLKVTTNVSVADANFMIDYFSSVSLATHSYFNKHTFLHRVWTLLYIIFCFSVPLVVLRKFWYIAKDRVFDIVSKDSEYAYLIFAIHLVKEEKKYERQKWKE